MSLKGFHIVFMCAAVLLSIGVGMWSLEQQQHGRAGDWLLWAVASFVVAAALVAYEVWFLRKTRQVSSW